jgi:predicted dehydrogenase
MFTLKPSSRRSFLKSTAALTAAAPFILPSRVWSAEVKPNDRLALGFIGMGTQNRGLLGGFIGRKETQVVAVCDVDTNRREDAKKRVEDHYAKQTDGGSFKGCAAYDDFRALLVRKDIDAVVIATPDHWHAYITIAAAKAGKDVYCEKPLCQSIHEARAMVNAVRKNKRIFQTGSMQRSSKEFRVACELVRNGVIGKISKVEVAIGVPGIPCDLPTEADEPGLDWNLWLGPAPERGYHSKLSPRGVHKHFPGWRDYREYGGGMVTDWGAHHFDIAQWGLGMDQSGPVEIIPADNPKATQGVRLLYANGVEVTHVNSGYGVVFHGSGGVVKVNRGKFELWLGGEQKTKADAKVRDEADRIEKEYLADAKVRLYNSSSHGSDWLNSIKTRKPPISDVEVGARSVTVCHLTNLAYYHGQKMKWNPKSEKFTSGTGNKAWLNVPHRDPWQVA